MNILEDYQKTWKTLLDYDMQSLELPKNRRPATQSLSYEETRKEIDLFRETLTKTEGNVGLFGVEREEIFRSILKNIEQEMFGSHLYPTVEEKASNLFYFIVKDHPFSDGNKRIGAFLFLRYLHKEGVPLPSPDTVIMTTLLLAGSEPRERELLIALIASTIPPLPDLT